MSKFYKRKQEEEVENFKKLLDDKKRVKYCGYRQRLIENIIYIFKDYEKNEELKQIEIQLFEEVGKKRQNDDVFTIELKKGGEFHIMLVDSYIIVGLSLN